MCDVAFSTFPLSRFFAPSAISDINTTHHEPTMSTPPPPPVSLGKPSLRHRLESYYSLVAPEAISNKEEWTRKFEIIYNKYGGDHIKERKLADKLAKKYGEQVRLLVAPPHRSQLLQRGSSGRQEIDNSGINKANDVHDEQHYKIDDDRINSKILDFTSPNFDPIYALSAPEGIVVESNASIFSSSPISVATKLDNISKFRALLPECDPQRLEPNTKRQKNKSNNTAAQNKRAVLASNNNETATAEQKKKKLPLFLSMASSYEHPTSGPLSLLYSILQNKQRIRIMIRYVDCIRGTLTGYLIAFDKHFNMILKDVDEVYGGRVTLDVGAVELAATTTAAGGGNGGEHHQQQQEAAAAPSKPKLEAQRRKCYPKDGSGGPGPAVKQRYFNQLMVRGDNVVMVWRADSERSVHPRTNKSPANSAYAAVDDSNGGSSGSGKNEAKIGTPGSLYYALQRWESQNNGRKRHS